MTNDPGNASPNFGGISLQALLGHDENSPGTGDDEPAGWNEPLGADLPPLGNLHLRMYPLPTFLLRRLGQHALGSADRVIESVTARVLSIGPRIRQAADPDALRERLAHVVETTRQRAHKKLRTLESEVWFVGLASDVFTEVREQVGELQTVWHLLTREGKPPMRADAKCKEGARS